MEESPSPLDLGDSFLDLSPAAPKRPREADATTEEAAHFKIRKVQGMSSVVRPSKIPNPFAVPLPIVRNPANSRAPLASRSVNSARSGSAVPSSSKHYTAPSLRSASTVSVFKKPPARPTPTRNSGCSLVGAAPPRSSRSPQARKPTALEEAKQGVSSFSTENQRLKGAVTDLRRTKQELEAQVAHWQQEQQEAAERADAQQKAKHDIQSKAKAAINSLREENAQLRQDRDKLRVELERLREDVAQIDRMKKQISSLKEETQNLTASNEQYALTLEHTKRELGQRMAELVQQQELSTALGNSVNNLEKSVEQKQEEMAQMDHLLKSGEALRRRMHNTIQELKGNIRVYCRVRPSRKQTPSAIQVATEDDKALSLTTANAKTATGQDAVKDHQFQFDKVFAPTATNEAVFEEISQLVQSALDGYRVCIFAYGQTGSGKTYTMEGPQAHHTTGSDVLGHDRGMIPRAVNQIFRTSKELEVQGWTFTLTAQFLEIYNEAIRDLLADEESAVGSSVGSPKGPSKIKIKHDRRATTVTNVKVVPVSDASTVCKLLKKASKNRAFAATQCNERSSRSHSVFTLTIQGTNAGTHQQTYGVLNLVDLAGSERLTVSGAVLDRQKETQHINKSLSSLGDVIAALAAKQPHVPFRNSKLTYLLQNCLGGDAKTLMFVNVSPDAEHAPESLCSLRFAAKVNSCEIGTAKRSVVSRD